MRFFFRRLDFDRRKLDCIAQSLRHEDKDAICRAEMIRGKDEAEDTLDGRGQEDKSEKDV
jgi:hypothetical protein